MTRKPSADQTTIFQLKTRIRSLRRPLSFICISNSYVDYLSRDSATTCGITATRYPYFFQYLSNDLDINIDLLMVFGFAYENQMRHKYLAEIPMPRFQLQEATGCSAIKPLIPIIDSGYSK